MGFCYNVQQCFSTGLPRNLRVPPVVSKGSADHQCSVQILNCDRHLRPQGVISRFLVGPKCICGWDSAPNSSGGSYWAPTDPLAGGEGARCHLQETLSTLGLRPLISKESPQKRHGLCEQLCCRVLVRPSSLKFVNFCCGLQKTHLFWNS